MPGSLNQVSPGGAAGNGVSSSANINYYQNSNQNSNRAGVSAGAMLTGGRATNTATHLQQMQQNQSINPNYGDQSLVQSGYMLPSSSAGQPQLSRELRGDPRTMPQPPNSNQGGTLSQ